jgi:arylsulfatase A
MITRMDRDVGRILSLLRDLDLERNTIVFFTSDNGGATKLWSDNYFESTGALRGHKQNLYEGGIRVPMIARWPGRIRARHVSGHPWAFCDILPTFAELASVNVTQAIDGTSVLPTLLGRKQAPHEYMYWEFPRYNAKTGEFAKEIPMQAVRMSDWKAVRPEPGGELELYNLRADIGETRNVAAQQPEIMSKIKTYLATARTAPRPQKDPPQDFVRA